MTRVLVVTGVDLEARALARHLGLPPVPGASFPHFAAGVLEIVCVGLRAAYLDARVGGPTAAPVAGAGRIGLGSGARYPTRGGPQPDPARASVRRAADSSGCALVISAGTCAALSPDLRQGALVVPESVVTPDGVRRAAARVAGLDARGALVTVDGVLDSAGAKSRVWLAHRAVAADMESAVILEWAAARRIPAGVVRGVSDVATRGVPADLAAVVADDGRLRTFRAVTAVLSRPRAAADALALRAGTAAALKSVATALATIARTVAGGSGR